MAKQIEVSRIFNAPVELVWRIWMEPEFVKQWWGPKNFTAPVARMDFREHGKSIVSMKAPAEMGGQEFYSVWEYKKIIPLYTIEFVQNLADENGNKVLPTSVGMPADFPLDIHTVVTFRAISDNQTEMTVTEYADFGQTTWNAKTGLEQCFEKMARIVQVL